MLISSLSLVIAAYTLAAAASAAGTQTRPLDSWSLEASNSLSPHGPGMNLDRKTELDRYLRSSGILSRTGPYRVALPLASFGTNGPQLLFTYVPRMKDGGGSKVFMFFIRMNID